MNNLAKIKSDKSHELYEKLSTEELDLDEHQIFNRGFDAVIALDLPVKFTIWKEQNVEDKGRGHYWVSGEDYTPVIIGVVNLYKYWINNIYKPE